MPCRSSLRWLESGEKGIGTSRPASRTLAPRHMPYHLGPSAARQAVNSTIPYSLSPALPCPSRAVLYCARLQGDRETERQRGRLSRHAGHSSIDRSQSTHGSPCFQEPPRPASCNSLPALHRTSRRIESTAAEANPSSLQPPTSNQLRHPNLPTSIRHPAPSWTTAFGLRPGPRPGRGPRPGPGLPALLLDLVSI